MKKKKQNEEVSEAVVLEEEKEKKAKKSKHKKVWRIIDRIFGVFLVTGIVAALGGLALEYVLVKGPSPALKELFIMTMHETRRFDFISNVYLSEEEVAEIIGGNQSTSEDYGTDYSLISIAANDGDAKQLDENGTDAWGLTDDDGDGIIYVDLKGPGYVGYMIVVLDPHRVFVGMPEGYGPGYAGMSLEDLVKKYDAIGGINGGGFTDEGGGGLGGDPQGLTVVQGDYYGVGYDYCEFVGIDDEGMMHVGYFEAESAQAINIQNGVSFYPLLIVNGEPADLTKIVSGVNPRSAIGQRSDGAIIMIAIDGRQVHSMGATYQDVIDIMLGYGVVNACNLDGGSSSSLYMNGEYINKCSSASGFSRNLPNGFLFK